MASECSFGYIWLGLLFFFLSSQGVDAQIKQFEGKRIGRIEYSPPQILDPADLQKVQPLKEGTPLDASDVARAIDGLYATGRFVDIAVEAELSGDGVTVRFVTDPQWFVGGIEVEGKIAAPPNRAELISNGQFTLGAAFHDEDVARAVDSMTRLFHSNGLYEMKLAPKIERDSQTQEVFLTFQVRSGKRAKYDMPVIQGNALLPESTVLRATGWRVPVIHLWRHVTDARTRKGVQSLVGKYQQQKRLLARVDLQELDYDPDRRKIQPHLEIEPGPKVEIKAIEAKVSQRVLKRYVPVFQEQTVDNDLLVEGKRNLQDYFQSQGYHDVDVEFRVQPPQNDLETIEYVISKGERFKVVQVVVTGNKYFDVKTIRERMFIQQAALNLRRGRYSEAFRRKDEANIGDLYNANGFRDAKVTIAADRDYRGKAGDVAVTVNISEGPQWLVASLTVNGIAKMKSDQITSLLASIVGQPFAEINLASDRDAVLTYYYEHGFPAANFQAQWRPGGMPERADVVYTISEGEEQFVRDVLRSGLRTTRESVINRAITMKPGDPLSPVRETDIQRTLYDLGVFARVDTAIENPDGDTSHKYVLYDFDEANRYNLSVGVGAQVARFGQPSAYSLGNPGGSTGFSPEVSLDFSRLNFLGLGHTVSFHGVYSSIDKLGSVSYLQPRFRNIAGRNITYTLLYNQELDVRTFASRREEASVQMSQNFSKSLTGLFKFAYRRVSVSNVVIPVLLIPDLVQPVRIGILSANFAQDRRDNPANPHRGIYNTADVGVSGKFFGSQRSFARILLRNATYYKLSQNIVLARQTQFGVIAPFAAPSGLSAQESVPLPERFFAGGADSLRAFPFNQAGPRDTGAPVTAGGPSSQPTGFPLGGNALFINNVELRFPLLGENIQGVLFHDMGNVYSTLSDISFRSSQRNLQDFNYMVHAAGVGVRYKTPVGPVRVDLAYSINPPAYDGFNGTPQQLLQCNPNEPNPASYCQPSRQQTSHFQFFFSIGQTF
jgi:outer membrane protein insertion porin family